SFRVSLPPSGVTFTLRAHLLRASSRLTSSPAAAVQWQDFPMTVSTPTPLLYPTASSSSPPTLPGCNRGHGVNNSLQRLPLAGTPRLSQGGPLEDQLRKRGSDLTQAGLSEGTLYAPVYHALKGGHAGPFEVPDPPQA
ncbi:hypothetical protein KUCAC02_027747, partial [Chaenocephalus aceratus]